MYLAVRTGCSWSLLEYINLFLKKSFVYKNIGIYLNFNLQYLDSSSLNNLNLGYTNHVYNVHVIDLMDNL